MNKTDPNKDKTAARKIWDSRNPQHETNADTGEDMFYPTMELCMTEFAATEAQQFDNWKRENKWKLADKEADGYFQYVGPSSIHYKTFTELYNLYSEWKEKQK